MRMKKKGALELSINAIVILILAITMLGLGLMFMKGTFGGVTKQFGEVSESIKKEMIDRMKESTSKVMLNVYEIEMKRSEEKSIYLAINNDLNNPLLVNYQICTKDLCDCAATGTCSVRATGATPSPGRLDCSRVDSSARCSDISVLTFTTKNIGSGEVDVLPIKVKVLSGAIATTYMIPIVVTNPSSEEQQVDLYVTIK